MGHRAAFFPNQGTWSGRGISLASTEIGWWSSPTDLWRCSRCPRSFIRRLYSIFAFMLIAFAPRKTNAGQDIFLHRCASGYGKGNIESRISCLCARKNASRRHNEYWEGRGPGDGSGERLTIDGADLQTKRFEYARAPNSGILDRGPAARGNHGPGFFPMTAMTCMAPSRKGQAGDHRYCFPNSA